MKNLTEMQKELVQSKDVEICQENIEGQFNIDEASREYWMFKI